MKIQILVLVFGLAGMATAFGLFSGSGMASAARVSHHGNGQVKETTFFIDGERHGLTTRFYADGTLRAEGQHENGKMVGEWIWQLPDGSPDAKRSGTYLNGKRISS